MEILCLDTDVLIDFLRGEPETAKSISRLEDGFILATTAINIYELYYGAFKTKKASKNAEAVGELATRLEVLQFTERSAEISGRIIAELEREGKPLDFGDAMIVGIVLENQVTLFTRNLRNFRRISGIRLYEA